MKIFNFIKSIKSYLYPGIIFSLSLFLLGNILSMSSTFMGNRVDAAVDIVMKNFLPAIILIIGKIFFVYLITGCVLSAVFYRACLEIKKILDLKFSPSAAALALLFLHSFVIFSEKIIINPQLYSENLESGAGFLYSYQKFLTDNIPPAVFGVISYIIIFAAAGLFLASFRREVKAGIIINRIKTFRYRKSAAGIIIIIFMIFSIWHLAGSGVKKSKFPNIIILSSDALRPDHFSSSGYRRDTTPSIDRIASEAMQVRGMITTVPRTFPAWASILTTQYTLENNIMHMFPRTAERNIKFRTAAGNLAGLGYRTAVISDFGGDIFPRLSFGFSKTRAPDMNFITLIKQIALEKQVFLLPFITNRIGMLVFPEIRGTAKFSIPDTLTEEAINEIESSDGNPFFIVVFHSVTHFPFSAPYPYYKKYADPAYGGPCKYLKQRMLKIEGGSLKEETSADDEKQVVALYDGCLSLFDREVGKIYDYLRDHDLLADTILVVTSDHGENLYEPGLGLGHGEHLKSNYPLEVPLIIRSDKHRDRGGKTIFAPSSITDIMPTIYDIAGIPAPDFFKGKSVLRDRAEAPGRVDAYCETGIWFDNNKSSPLFFNHERIDYPDITGISEIDFSFRDEVVIQQKFQNIVKGAKYRTIYSGRYKLIYIPLPRGPVFELYDFISDPENKNDLSRENTDALTSMKKKFYDFINEKSSGNYIIKNGIIFPVFSDPVF